MRTELVQAYQGQFKRMPEALVRVPGRINLMGRHVDHQGGDVNMLALDRYLFVAASRSSSRSFHFRSTDPGRYPDFDFSASALPFALEGRWEKVIETPGLTAWRETFPLWGRYLVGAVLRLSMEIGQPLPPMEALVHGNLPAAAGLSSSSALVLGLVLAADAFNEWNLDSQNLVRLSSEAERFLGVRGGASDPAAMLASRAGCIVHLGCLPFRIQGVHSFSRDYRIVLANSQDLAMKGRSARNDYNWRVAVYRIAFALLRHHRPEWTGGGMQHLRDVHPKRLGVPPSEIYQMLRSLPEYISRGEFAQRYPEESQDLQEVFSSHTEPPGGYPVRDILLYGMAEMARARQAGALLDRGEYAALGRWMNVSHDGDRVSERAAGERRRWRPARLTDRELDRLTQAADAGDQSADLVVQTGSYTCSTPNVDEMVDICLAVDGCLGSQILGAGLGGCMMALVQAGAEEEVMQQLKKSYYGPRGLAPEVWATFPGPGASVERLA